jgi:hypothetical protein
MKFYAYVLLAFALLSAGSVSGVGLLLLADTFDSLLSGALVSFAGIIVCFSSAALVLRRMDRLS